MSLKIDKNEQYVVFTPSVFGGELLKDLEKEVVQSYKQGIVNYVIDLSSVASANDESKTLLAKINRLCQRESGLLVIAAAEPQVLDIIDELEQDDVLFLPTLHEAVEAIFMNELENEFKDEADEEDMYGFGDDEGGKE